MAEVLDPGRRDNRWLRIKLPGVYIDHSNGLREFVFTRWNTETERMHLRVITLATAPAGADEM